MEGEIEDMFENDSVQLAFLMAVILTVIFVALGKLILKKKSDILEQFIVGAFVYFGLFQCFAFPFTMIGIRLSRLSIVWMIVVVGIFVLSFIPLIGNCKQYISQLHMNQHEILYGLLAVFLFNFIWEKSLYSYGSVGWDTSHYIGSISNAVYTDSLYQFDGAEGWPLSTINLHFAMCGFYMHTAVLCQVFHIHPLLVQRYTIGSIAILLAVIIIYKTITLILKNRRRSLQALVIGELLLFYYYTSYTGPFFLLNRIVEAKTWCAMVIYPALAWALVKLYQKTEKESWLCVFAIAFASVSISVSSLIGVPVMILAVTVAIAFRDRRWKECLYGIICMIPNGLYCLLYLMSKFGWLVFEVR